MDSPSPSVTDVLRERRDIKHIKMEKKPLKDKRCYLQTKERSHRRNFHLATGSGMV